MSATSRTDPESKERMLMLYRTLKEHEDFLKIYKYVGIYTLEEYKNERE